MRGGGTVVSERRRRLGEGTEIREQEEDKVL